MLSPTAAVADAFARRRVGSRAGWHNGSARQPRGVPSWTAARASRYRSLAAWLTSARRCKSAIPWRSGRQSLGPSGSPSAARYALKSPGSRIIVSVRNTEVLSDNFSALPLSQCLMRVPSKRSLRLLLTAWRP